MTNEGISPARQAHQDTSNLEAEFDALSKELAEKELELATLENELASFEKRYVRTVGVLFAELDRLNCEIARELARLHPEEEYQQSFQRAEKKAQTSQEAVDGINDKAEKPPYIPSEEIKNLYRKVAKMIHPDLATSESERAYRTTLMSRANVAYKNGDQQTLEQILYEWEHRDEKIMIEMQAGAAFVADPLEQKIAQIRRRLKEIARKIDAWKQSDRYQLMRKVERADREGRDLLANMARELQKQIRAAQELLESLRNQA